MLRFPGFTAVYSGRKTKTRRRSTKGPMAMARSLQQGEIAQGARTLPDQHFGACRRLDSREASLDQELEERAASGPVGAR